MIWVGIVLISLFGTLAHFLYEISGCNKVLGIFTAVNESTWEHIKIALTPTLIWGLVDGYIYGADPNYFLAKLASLLTLVVVIPVIFYSYKLITKKPVLFIDITTFYLAIILSQFVFYKIIEAPDVNFLGTYLACAGTFIFFGAYTLLTLMPLKNPIFKDPITHKYGFRAHTQLFKKSPKNSKKKKTH